MLPLLFYRISSIIRITTKVIVKVVIENNILVSIDARNNKMVLAAKQRKISL